MKKPLDLKLLHSKGYVMFTFIEHPAFTKQIESLFTDDEYRRLQTDLAANPESGNVIPGLAGLRKLRWGAKGKEAGWSQNHLLTYPEARYRLPVFTHTPKATSRT